MIAVPDEKWSERPLAVVVLREGETATPDELREFLAPSFAKWWLPDRFEFVDEIPKTAVGKFRKTALREQFAAQPDRETGVVGDFIIDGARTARSPSSRSTTRPMNALSAPLLTSSRPRSTASTRDDAVRAIVPRRRGRARVRRGRGHQGVPVLREAPRETNEARLGARDPEARAPDGRGAHAVRRRDPRVLPRRRARARDVLRHPRRLRRRAARAAGDQARARSRAAAARSGCRVSSGIGRAQLPQPRPATSSTPQTAYDWGLVEKVVPREELRETALGIARTIAARSPVSDRGRSASSRGRRATSPLEEGLRREADGFRRCLRVRGRRGGRRRRSSRSASLSFTGRCASRRLAGRRRA